MVWDGGSKPLVVPTSWVLLGVALGEAPVWPSSRGVGFTEKSVVRRPPCYLPLEQLEEYRLTDFFIILDLINLAAWSDIPSFRKHIYYLPTGGNIVGVLEVNVLEDVEAIRCE